jgi:hypothetical protein
MISSFNEEIFLSFRESWQNAPSAERRFLLLG